MQKGRDVLDVRFRERGHFTIRTAVDDDRTDRFAVLVMAEGDGSDQVRTPAAGRIFAMAKTAGLHEFLSASLHGLWVRFGGSRERQNGNESANKQSKRTHLSRDSINV